MTRSWTVLTFWANSSWPTLWIWFVHRGPKRFDLFRTRWLTNQQESLLELLTVELSSYFNTEVNLKERVNSLGGKTKWKWSNPGCRYLLICICYHIRHCWAGVPSPPAVIFVISLKSFADSRDNKEVNSPWYLSGLTWYSYLIPLLAMEPVRLWYKVFHLVLLRILPYFSMGAAVSMCYLGVPFHLQCVLGAAPLTQYSC